MCCMHDFINITQSYQQDHICRAIIPCQYGFIPYHILVFNSYMTEETVKFEPTKSW